MRNSAPIEARSAFGPAGSAQPSESATKAGPSALRLLGDRPEGLRIADRQVCEHLAVELDVRLLQAGDELVVREPVRPRSRVDPHDPETAEGPLLVLAIPVRVGQRVVDLLLGVAIRGLLEAPVPLGLLQDLAPLLPRRDRALDAWH